MMANNYKSSTLRRISHDITISLNAEQTVAIVNEQHSIFMTWLMSTNLIPLHYHWSEFKSSLLIFAKLQWLS